MSAEAEVRGAERPVTAAALGVFDTARSAGWAGRDGATLPAYRSLAHPPKA